MSVPKAVVDLVERFRRNENAYRSGQYNETQVRREFIDPFFECLGWDVNNRQGYAEAYKEVIHEDSLDVEGAKRAPRPPRTPNYLHRPPDRTIDVCVARSDG